VRGGLRLREHALALSQSVLHLADVGDQRDEPPHAAAGVAIRDVGHPEVARVGGAELDPCLVRDLLAGQHARHVVLNRLPGGLPDDLARVPPNHRLGRTTEPASVGVVGPDVAHLRIQVREQRGDLLGDESKDRLQVSGGAIHAAT
jgi:hypothetical protein